MQTVQLFGRLNGYWLDLDMPGAGGLHCWWEVTETSYSTKSSTVSTEWSVLKKSICKSTRDMQKRLSLPSTLKQTFLVCSGSLGQQSSSKSNLRDWRTHSTFSITLFQLSKDCNTSCIVGLEPVELFLRSVPALQLIYLRIHQNPKHSVRHEVLCVLSARKCHPWGKKPSLECCTWTRAKIWFEPLHKEVRNAASICTYHSLWFGNNFVTDTNDVGGGIP